LGQQHLLIIILALIVVGVAVAFGIQLFRQHAINSKRDQVMNESANLASMAMIYFKKPLPFGGGGKSFLGWSIPGSLQYTPSGSYTADIYSDSVIITGIGTEIATGNDSIQVKTTVLPSSYRTTVIR
jgi:hypothetical protein